MGKSKSPKQDVTEYLLTVHIGACLGPVDYFRGILINEKQAWRGKVSDAMSVPIYNRGLFGGPQKEGGVEGVLHFLPGKGNQLLPANVTARFGKTPETSVAYRGLASIYFTGANIGQGFLWGMNNPIVAQTVDIEVTRAAKGLNPEYEFISNPRHPDKPDANPAHIIYEAATDPVDGIVRADDVDFAALNEAGERLYSEGMGMSLLWSRGMACENFLNEIQAHINSVIYTDPETGLMTLKLVRDDYDPETLFEINADNAELIKFQRKMPGESTNEIVVTYTDPATEKEATVTVHDLPSASVVGSVSDSRNYYGFRRPELAEEAGWRELLVANAPLASVDVLMNRDGWKLRPGQPVRVYFPDADNPDKTINIIARVGEIDYGKPDAEDIPISLLEDVWSLARPPLSRPAESEWVDESEPPTPMAAQLAFTLPSYMVLSTSYQEQLLELEYPEVVAATLGHHPSPDAINFELFDAEVQPTGELEVTSAGVKTFTERGTLIQSIPPEATSNVLWTTLPLGRGPRIGGFALVGSADAAQEFMLIRGFDGFQYTVDRGVLDTIPRAWPSGTPVWFVNPNTKIVDDRTVRSAGETVTYRMAPRTSLGQLPLDQATPVSATLTDRPYLPLRPANVKVNGVPIQGTVNVSTANDIAITWATRNRVLEDGQVVAWDAAPVAPEYKQRTVIVVSTSAGVPIRRYVHLWTENSFTIPKAWYARYTDVRIYIHAERDGLDSLQALRFDVTGLPGDAGAAEPPAAPDAGVPPPPVAAPAADDFTAYGGVTDSGPDGQPMPAIFVKGRRSISSMIGLSVRYAVKPTENVLPDWQYHPTATLDERELLLPIAPVASKTTYLVECAYVAAENIIGFYRSLGEVTSGSLVIDEIWDGGQGVPTADIIASLRTTEQLVQETAERVDQIEGGFDEALAEAQAAAATAVSAADDAAAAALQATDKAADASASAVAAQSSAGDSGASAAASAASASVATTKADEAEQSASAAQADRLLAETARGQAQTSATQAASARDDAAGSAASASSSATNAANSRDAAAGSASAAAGSASTATTKAGEAGISAAAAMASQVSASTARDEAMLALLQQGRTNLVARENVTPGSPITSPSPSLSGWGFTMTGTGSNVERGIVVGPLKQNTPYSVSFRARRSDGATPQMALDVDLYPDTLPQRQFQIGPDWTDFKWEGLSSAHGDMTLPNVRLRFFRAPLAAGVSFEVTDIKLEEGATASAWTPSPKDAPASATAAATSASSAAASETAAGQSASAASGFATNASTSAGQAQTYSNQASVSAADAQSASVSAGVAASTARMTAIMSLPERMADVENFAGALSGRPETIGPFAWGTPYTHPVEGDVLRVTGAYNIVNRGWLKIEAGRTYRVTVRAWVSSDGPSGNRTQIGYRILAADGTSITVTVNNRNAVSADGFTDFSWERTAEQIWALRPQAVYIRAHTRPNINTADNNSSGATTDLAFMRLEDVTESVAAAASAAAAVTQAANASASAANAQISAELAASISTEAGFNLLPNSTFADGMTGWTTTTWFQSNLTAAFGPHAFCNLNGTNQMAAAPVVVNASNTYTLSADFRRLATSGNLVMDVEWLNSTGGLISRSARIIVNANQNFGEQARKSVTVTPPAGAATGRIRAFGENISGIQTNGLAVRQIKFEVGTKATMWRDDMQAAQMSAQLSVTYAVAVDAQTRLSTARFDVKAAAGSDPAQLQVAADGSGSLIGLLASQLSFSTVVNGVAYPVMKLLSGAVYISGPVYIGFNKEIELYPLAPNPYISIKVGSGRIAMGKLPNDNLIYWFGPTQEVSNMRKNNAREWRDTSGNAYFGGTIIAGTISNSGQGTNINVPAEFTLGPFGTNGGPITVAWSYEYSRQGKRWGNSTGGITGNTSALVRLYRRIAGQAETLIDTMTITGDLNAYYDAEPVPGQPSGTQGQTFFTEYMGNSRTYTDSAGGTQQRTYRIQVVSRTLKNVPGDSNELDNQVQRYGITSSE